MPTPESVIKRRVNKLLRAHDVYYFMPVQTGMGAAGLDYHCVKEVQGFPLAFFVETKAFGKTLTARQEYLTLELQKYRARTFVVDCNIDLERLERWLIKLETYGLIALIPDSSPELLTYLDQTGSLPMDQE